MIWWSTNDSGLPAVAHVSLSVRPGEIVGIAGVSGNGQRELVEALIGQRHPAAGEIRVDGKRYHATRGEIRACRAFSLPEEPLQKRLRARHERGGEHGAPELRRGRRSPRARGSGAVPCSSSARRARSRSSR